MWDSLAAHQAFNNQPTYLLIKYVLFFPIRNDILIYEHRIVLTEESSCAQEEVKDVAGYIFMCFSCLFELLKIICLLMGFPPLFPRLFFSFFMRIFG